MKKKLIFLAVSLFFIGSLMTTVLISSKDMLFNIKNGLNNVTIPADSIEFINWNGSDRNFTSGEHAQIILRNVSSYVHNVTIKGSLSEDITSIRYFYTSEQGEDFSEEKCAAVPCTVSGNNISFYVDSDVDSLRIDLTDNANTELFIRGISINSKLPVISINLVGLCCILPTVVIAALIISIVYRKQLGTYFAVFKKFVPLLKNLVSRDFKVKYRRSVLGFLWSVLNPLLMALVFNAVFSHIFRFQIQYYAAYYLTGSLIFNFVIEASMSSMTSVLSSASLIKKVYIPKYIFPLEKCIFAFINMLFSSVALVVVLLIQKVPFSWNMLLFLIPMFYALIFAYGLSLILSAVTVFFRDMEHLYSVVTTVWMYLTPIIYPEEVLKSSGLILFAKLNPMYYYVHSLRNVVLYSSLPTASDNLMCISFALCSLILGIGVFKKLQDKFILYI